MFLGLVGRMNGTLYLFVFALICGILPALTLSYLSSDPPSLSFFSLPFLADVSEALPMMIIIGGAVGGGCVLLICVITLVSLCCRHTGKGELNGQYGQDGSTATSFPFTLHFVFAITFPFSPALGFFFLKYKVAWKCQVKLLFCWMLAGKRCTRLSKSDIRVQIVHSDHNATRSNDDEEDVKEPMVNVI